MSEFDELENMFSDAFSDEKVTPPKSVKQNIDRSLFGSNGRVIWLFALLFLLLLPVGGILIYNQFGSNSIENGSIVTNNPIDEFPSEDSNQLQSLIENEEYKMNAKIEAGTAVESRKVQELNPGVAERKLNTINKEKSEKNTGGETTPSSEIGDQDVSGHRQGDTVEDQKTEGIWNDHEKANLLALKGIKDRPLPYDLLMMCATKPIPKRNPISLEVYTGVEKGFVDYDYRKSVEPLVAMDRKLSEDLGASISVEVSYPITGRFSLASGVGIHRGINTFSRGSFGVDSTYTGDTLIITQYFDTVNQVQMTDSTYFATYDYNEYETTETTQILRTTYFLPIYLKYERTLGYNWRFSTSFGVRLSYDQIKLRDNTLELNEKEFKRFGMSAILRPELSYQLNKWNFGVYGQTGYDMLHGLSGDITRVKRYSVGGGLRFRYTF